MMQRNFKILLFVLSITQSTHPITLLYSMKIRRVFAGALQRLDDRHKRIWAFTVLPIVYARQRHFTNQSPCVDIREKRLLVGALLNLRCVLSEHYWFEITTAFENERGKAKGISENPLLPFCKNVNELGMDDITFEAGYHMYPSEKLQLDAYIISGFPTHTRISKKDTLGTYIGTRFIGLGAGMEISYSFIESLRRSLIFITQARYVHFFDRNWFPVLPCGSTIQPGDTIDFLAALRYREKWDKIEIGYNPTWFVNQAVKIPDQGKVRSKDFMRNGAYINWNHTFDRPEHPIVLGAGTAFNVSSFAHTRIYNGWISVTFIF